MRDLLRHRDFRLLLAAQTLSMFGDWTLLLVLGIWAKTLTGSDAVAGLTVFAMAAPGVLAPVAGVLVDRLPRRTVLLGLNLASTVVVSSLWLVHDRGQLWLLFAVAAWYGIASVTTNAATSGLVQVLLPAELLGVANGALNTVRQGLRLLGPLVGAGLFAAVGGRWVATVDAAAFVLATAVLVRVRFREPAPRAGRRTGRRAGRRGGAVAARWRTEVAAGLVHLWRVAPLRRLARSTLVFSASVGLAEATVYALVGDGLHRPPEFVGVLVSVQGAGALAGGVSVSLLVARVRETPLIGSGMALVALGAALSATAVLPVVLAGFLVLGAGLPVLAVAAATSLQRRTPNDVMGRVAAGYEMVSSVPTTASIAVGALLVGVLPFAVVLLLMAAGCATAALLVVVGGERGDGPAVRGGAHPATADPSRGR
ncbi:MFS transporter [Kineococcus rhizosphaerae]|uniref:MFS transporter n=1 Tax=Kineococcus rhizosphaerae TaxID=559628 RepID=A0A2T0RB37_9ACTN|nr:MFS transporter [Kineococcus rhizosphaerae]PRY18351.1 MFS transporter [Kineococcus rhizosphaerae]